jgi:Acyl carrier protein
MTVDKLQFKTAIIRELHLEDMTPDLIDDSEPLFGEGKGLGLDSLDAVELAVLVQREFGVTIEDSEEVRQAFTSINALATYVEEAQKK